MTLVGERAEFHLEIQVAVKQLNRAMLLNNSLEKGMATAIMYLSNDPLVSPGAHF